MLKDTNLTTKYTPEKYKAFTDSAYKILHDYEYMLLTYDNENKQYNLYCDLDTIPIIHFQENTLIFSKLSTTVVDTLVVDILNVFLETHHNHLNLISELFDQTPKFKVKNLKNLDKYYLSFYRLIDYSNTFENIHNNYPINLIVMHAYTYLYKLKTSMSIQNPNIILLKSISFFTYMYDNSFFVDLMSLLFHSFDYSRKLEYKRVPHKWNPKWTRTLKITTLTHTIYELTEAVPEYPITLISEYEESDIKPDDIVDGGFYANALNEGSVIDDITYEQHEEIINVLENTEGTVFHTIMLKKQAILDRESFSINNSNNICIDYLIDNYYEGVFNKPYKNTSKDTNAYSSDTTSELNFFENGTVPKHIFSEENFLENELEFAIETPSVNFFHYLHNLYSSYRCVKRIWLPIHRYKTTCFDDIVIVKELNSNIFFNIFITIALNISKHRLESNPNIVIVLFKQTQKLISTKTSFMRRPFKKNKKLARYIGIFFLKNYLRTYRKRNFLMYFTKLFLTSNSKISNNYFSWINPMSRKQKQQKRINVSYGSRVITFNASIKDCYKYNNYFPLFALRKSLFIKYSSVYFDKTSPSFSHFYTYYFIYFLETFLKTRVWFKCNTSARVPNSIAKKLKKLAKKTKRSVSIIGKHLFVLEMYELLWLSLFYKDISLFARWFKILMERIEFKRHKRMIKIIHNAVRLNKKLFLVSTGTKGFSVDIRGKLGVTGNAKKRHLAFTVGQISITKKKAPLHYYHNLIGTATGVLGVTYFVMS